MAAAALHRVTLLVSDYQVLLVSDAQDVLRPMAPGSTKITRACRVPVQPYQAGRCLILTSRRYCHDRRLVPNPDPSLKVMNA
jgi:hypothetical protein